MKTLSKLLSVVLCLTLVLGLFTFGASAANTATLVTNVSDLAAGDKIIIVGANGEDYYALGTNQKSNNRAAVKVTVSDATVTYDSTVQVITLEAGTKTNTFAFKVDTGYLYAASSSDNHLKTETDKSDNSSWSISIAGGVATIKAQGSNTRNWLRYNSSSSLFSCYGSGQKDVYIYKIGGGGSACQHTNVTTATPYSVSASQHWKKCPDCGAKVGEKAHTTTAVGQACADCGFKVLGNYAIMLGNDKVMTVHDSGAVYPTCVPVSLTGSTITGPDNTNAILTWAEFGGKYLIMNSTGKFMGIESSKVNFGTAATAWTRTGNTLTMDDGGTTKTLAYSNQYSSFGIYAEGSLTNHVTELNIIANAVYQEQATPAVKINTVTTEGTLYKVTGAITYINGKNVYVQDDTGALCLYFNSAPSGLSVGQWITASGTYDDYYGLPELTGVTGYEEASGAALTPKTVTKLSDLTAADICQYVKISGVEVIYKGSAGVFLKDDSAEIKWQSPKKADNVTHFDTVTIQGVVGIHSGAIQLYNNDQSEVTVTGEHEHSMTVWKSDETGHWLECATAGCGQAEDKCTGTLTWAGDTADHWKKCTADGCAYTTGKEGHTLAGDFVSGGEAGHHKVCSVCSLNGPESNGHTWDGSYQKDENDHWQKCQDCTFETNHVAHTYEGTLIQGATGHYQKCACGVNGPETAHQEGSDGKCACGLDMKCPHQFEPKSDDDRHWNECKLCHAKVNEDKHEFATKTDADSHWTACSCGKETEKKAHQWTVKSDETNHWSVCSCGATKDTAKHTWDGYLQGEIGHYQKCTVCEYKTAETAHDTSSGTCVCGATKAAYNKVTDGKLVSGTYVLVASNGYAPTVLDGTWLLSAQPVVSGNQVTDPKAAILTLVVDGSKVTVTDANGKVIINRTKDNNMAASGEGAWTWEYKDGKFLFNDANGEELRYLAFNTAEDYLKFRAYKASSIEKSPDKYVHTFDAYRLGAPSGTQEPTNPSTNPSEPAGTTAPGGSTATNPGGSTAATNPGSPTCDHAGATYKFDSNQHWKVCSCGYVSERSYHTLVNGKCACGYEKKVVEGYFKVTSDKVTSGKYILTVDGGFALTALDGKWATSSQVTVSGNQVVDPSSILTLTFQEGNKVVITDGNGATLYSNPDNNELANKPGSAWNWKYENGKFVFFDNNTEEGQTRYLAFNASESGKNRFRAYRLSSMEQYADQYAYSFTLYQLTTSTAGNPNAGDSSVVALAIAAAVLSVMGSAVLVTRKKEF